MNKKRLTVILFLFMMICCRIFAGEVKGDNIIGAVLGEKFVITLESNATTGYEWQLVEEVDKDRIEFISSKYIGDSSGRVGAGGKEVWTFKATGEGSPTIRFKYVRPWEKDVPPADKKDFVIMIKK